MSPSYGYAGFSDTPADITETLTGIRHWRIDQTSGLLTSVAFADWKWQPGLNTAECLGAASYLPGCQASYHPGELLEHTPECRTPLVYKGCGCGLWGYTTVDGAWEKESLMRLGLTHLASWFVTGVFIGWGRAVVGPLGFRVEHGAVAAFTEPVRVPPSIPPGPVRARLERLYADVPWYRSVAAMVSAWPLSDTRNLLEETAS